MEAIKIESKGSSEPVPEKEIVWIDEKKPKAVDELEKEYNRFCRNSILEALAKDNLDKVKLPCLPCFKFWHTRDKDTSLKDFEWMTLIKEKQHTIKSIIKVRGEPYVDRIPSEKSFRFGCVYCTRTHTIFVKEQDIIIPEVKE